MAIMRTERLMASDGVTIQEERNFDGFGKLVSKRKNVKPATHASKQNTQQENNKMAKKVTANIPPQEEPLGIPGVNGYGKLKFHSSGIGYQQLSQMLQRELDRLEHDDMFLTVKEVYDDYFIYFSSTDNQLYRRDYVVTDGRVELSDTVTKVVEKTEYEPTNQQAKQPLLANGDVAFLKQQSAATEKEPPLLPLGYVFGK